MNTETLKTVVFVMDVIGWILTSIGIWMILSKCRKKKWPALVPGIRYYALSRVSSRETDGVLVMVFEAIRYGVDLADEFMKVSKETSFFLSVIIIIAALLTLIYKLRIVAGLVRVFEMKGRWILFWGLNSAITALVWGFSRKYRPVTMYRLADEEAVLAGTAPSSAMSAIDPDKSGKGLVIRIRERTVRSNHKKRWLLKDINLTIPNGSLVLLLGGSGAGKTTLVNAVIGYEKADADIYLNGVNVYDHYDEMKYKIGFVPQQDLLRYNDTVASTLNDAARMRLPKNMTRAQRKERVSQVMDILGLTAGKAGLVSKKSGGMKKRISIATELIGNPDLFVLDEPDSGLDGVIARELYGKLRDVADSGKIVMVITHTPDRVADLFDKVIVLARDSGRCGRLAFYGSPDEARSFFEKDTMEQIVMRINSKDQGGEDLADEYIEKFAQLTAERSAQND